MNTRQRFRSSISFGPFDQLLWHETIPDETILRWVNEGLDLKDALSEPNTQMSVKGAMVSIPAPRVFDLRKHFGYVHLLSSPLSIDLGPLPRFYREDIDKGDGWVTRRTEHGVIEKLLTGHDFFMPGYLQHPVQTPEDWKDYEKRLDPHDLRRYPKSWGPEFIDGLRQSEEPVGICFHGLFAFGRELMGTTNFLMAFYDHPELVERMMNQRVEFLIEAMKPAVETLKSDIDYAFWHEDMAFRNGPFISPAFFRQFMLTGYKRLADFFLGNGIKLIWLDCDGDFRPLIPLYCEAGINGLWPLEAAAGIDAISLRKEYGRDFVLAGNIDKRILVSGSRDAIRDEVERKLGFFKEDGGFVISLDHSVSPDIPFDVFRYYVETVKSYIGGG